MPIPTQVLLAASYQEWKQQYHQELHRKADIATLEKVRRGEVVGRLPVGYEYDRAGQALLDASHEALLREAFLLAAEGKYSLRRILEVVAARGLTARSGKPLSVSQLWRILTDPFYAGKVTYRGEIVQGRHQPLVSEETFRTVQENMSRRRKR